MLFSETGGEPTPLKRCGNTANRDQEKKKARQAVPALTRAIAHYRYRDPCFVATAVRALGTIGDPQVIPLMAELLEGSYLAVRLAAVQALAHIGTPPALEALYRARADPSPTVRQAINRILGASPAGGAPTQERAGPSGDDFN